MVWSCWLKWQLQAGDCDGKCDAAVLLANRNRISATALSEIDSKIPGQESFIPFSMFYFIIPIQYSIILLNHATFPCVDIQSHLPATTPYPPQVS